MKNLKGVSVKGKRVLVRVDFNLPAPEPRIRRALPTIQYLAKKGAKVILLTHAEGNNGSIPSLHSLAKKLRGRYIKKLQYIPELTGGKAAAEITRMKNGEIVLLENLRKDPGEKLGSKAFARKLAEMGDLFVNEAFSASHRAHASIVLLPRILPSYPGFLFESEIKNLSKVFHPPHPFVLILGGGKVETKIPLLKKFSQGADQILLGGVAANMFLTRAPMKLRNVALPDDSVVRVGGKKKIFSINEIKNKMEIWDIGPKTISFWEEIIRGARLIVWNGPLGFMEKGFREGTERLYRALKKATKAEVVIGGGDTLAALPSTMPSHIFVSTGGGAMLEFLAKETLPGIEALQKSV